MSKKNIYTFGPECIPVFQFMRKIIVNVKTPPANVPDTPANREYIKGVRATCDALTDAIDKVLANGFTRQ